LRHSEFRADDSVLGHGPTGEAIKSGKPHYVNDIANDPHFVPWREKTMKEGFASSAAVPIKLNGQVVGALNLYSERIGFFDEAQQSFLGDLSLLLAEGLRKFRDESKSFKTSQS
jgi:GAF domain-containing protein